MSTVGPGEEGCAGEGVEWDARKGPCGLERTRGCISVQRQQEPLGVRTVVEKDQRGGVAQARKGQDGTGRPARRPHNSPASSATIPSWQWLTGHIHVSLQTQVGVSPLPGTPFSFLPACARSPPFREAPSSTRPQLWTRLGTLALES